MSFDVFPVFQVSPAETYDLLKSPVPVQNDSKTPGTVAAGDGLIGRESLLDLAPDPPFRQPPLLSGAHATTDVARQLFDARVARRPLSPVDVYREGPFDAMDTATHPIISNVLPGCPYRMTSYMEEDIAEVDLAFGVQLHHPRFLECIGAPEFARFFLVWPLS